MEKYDDIINLPHHVSKVHPRMPMYQRAAQFAPFAALTGHNAAIRETARLTDMQIELDDENNTLLNKKLELIRNHLAERPELTVTFFLPDEKKDGGSYATHTGKLRVIDDYEQALIMTDGKKIPLRAILYIDGKLFDDYEEEYSAD